MGLAEWVEVLSSGACKVLGIRRESITVEVRPKTCPLPSSMHVLAGRISRSRGSFKLLGTVIRSTTQLKAAGCLASALAG